MSDQATTPALRRLIEKIADERIAAVLQGPQPGRVTSYDKVKQRASVQPLNKRIYYDEEGQRQVKLRPVVQDAPVLFLGGGTTRITTGLKVGDTVLLIPCGGSIAQWVVRGGEVDPLEERGTLADAIVLAGLHDFGHVPTDAPDDALVLHADDVRLGGSGASDPVVRKSDLAALVSEYLGHTHILTLSSGTGTAAVPATTFTTPDCSPVTKTE